MKLWKPEPEKILNFTGLAVHNEIRFEAEPVKFKIFTVFRPGRFFGTVAGGKNKAGRIRYVFFSR
jgi:hypothetical protein